jgi:opacity protein-like surface antigen
MHIVDADVNSTGGVKMKKLLLAAAMIMSGSIANAADMPVKAAPYAPVPVFNWTGFYLGGEVGYVWGRTDNVTTLIPTTISTRPDGWVAALFGGYDLQLPNNVVIGARIAAPVWSNADDTRADPAFPVITYSGEFKWAVLATAQLGYAIGALQPYVGIGIGVGQGEATMNNPFFAPGPTVFSDEQTHVGLVLNAGVKYMFARNWFAGVHYTHIEWQNKTYNIVTPGVTFAADIGASSDSLVATLGYKF